MAIRWPMAAVPPDILDYPTSTDMVVREGSNVTLKCAATGSPEPTITWRRESGVPIELATGEEGKLRLVFWYTGLLHCKQFERTLEVFKKY